MTKANSEAIFLVIKSLRVNSEVELNVTNEASRKEIPRNKKNI